jgi:hypothetical protein
MAYVALKPCCFAGQKFWIGEAVPAELVLPEMAGRLIQMGKLAEVPDGKPEKSEEPDGKPEEPESKSESPPKPQRKQTTKSR